MNREVSHRIDLTEYVMRSFSAARIIRSHEDVVIGLDYSHIGDKLVSGSCAAISVIDTYGNGTERKCIPVRKYGAGALKFFQDSQADGSLCVASTADRQHTIRALELTRYSYTRTFKGHDAQVISISTSPVNSSFISGDVEGKMKLWDTREKSTVGYLNTYPNNRNGNTSMHVSFDPKGVIFGVLHANVVKLYDCKKFSQGPFVEFPVGDANANGVNANGHGNGGNNGVQAPQATSLKFSSDGEYFLVVFAATAYESVSCIRVFDAYKGNVSRTFYVPPDGHNNGQGYNNSQGIRITEASFSSDAKFVLAGSSNGSVYCWDLLNDKLVSRTDNFHSGNVNHIAFNPTLAQYATACQNVAIWVPHPSSSQNSNAY